MFFREPSVLSCLKKKVAHRKSHSGRKSSAPEKTETQEVEAETPQAEPES